MRTIEEVNNLIKVYQEALECDDNNNLYVITADAMTVNRNNKGRYEVSQTDSPTLFDKHGAEWRAGVESKKNTLFKYRVLKYKSWLSREIQKLESLTNARNQAIEAVETIDIEEPEVSDSTDSGETSAEYVEMKFEHLQTATCPCGNNNCLLCVYNSGVSVENRILTIRCTHPCASIM